MTYEMMAKPHSKYVADMAITEEPFMRFSKKYEALCVSLVDIADSTFITASLPLEKITLYYSLFLNSMAKTAKMFGARVVKNIGDSLLFYFPTAITPESVLECNISMIGLHHSLNSILHMHRLPDIDYRISSDYGPTLIAMCEKTEQEDIFGNSVNMCSKINRLAKKNTSVIGGDLYRLVKGLSAYSFRQTRHYESGFRVRYPVYEVSSLR